MENLIAALETLMESDFPVMVLIDDATTLGTLIDQRNALSLCLRLQEMVLAIKSTFSSNLIGFFPFKIVKIECLLLLYILMISGFMFGCCQSRRC